MEEKKRKEKRREEKRREEKRRKYGHRWMMAETAFSSIKRNLWRIYLCN